MKNLFEPGEQIETTVVAISKDTVFLDLSLKSEGLMDKAEVTDEDGNVKVKVGDKIKVYFTQVKDDEFYFTSKLSGDKADKSVLENAYKNSIPIEGHVEKEIKGGFEVLIGTTRAFCPYSQMGYKQKGEPASFIGKHLTFKIQEYKNDGRNVLVSNRAICEMEENEKLVKIEETLKVGMTVKGTVKTLQDYGAFVDVDGFQALLPISEISHARVQDIHSVLKEGQEIEVKIIKADWKNERMSLSMKSLEEDPWDSVAKKFPIGSKIDGTISRIADFGLFVTVEPGIDGLVHISELEGVDRNSNLKKLYKVGAPMSVIVEKIDPAEKRISLKPASSVEQDEETAKYMSSQDNYDVETYNPFAELLKKK